MSLIRVRASVRQSGRCKFCRAEIVWRITAAGKWVPFDPGVGRVGEMQELESGQTVEDFGSEARHTCRKGRTA